MTSRRNIFQHVVDGDSVVVEDEEEAGASSSSADRNPSTRTWPMFHRGHVRSCIEFSPAPEPIMATTPTNASGSTMVDLRTSSRLSNPFLELMFSGDSNLDMDDEEDQPSGSQSQSLSLSLLSNEDGDSDSSGTLSEVFDSLSRFSEACLASAEAISSASCTVSMGMEVPVSTVPSTPHPVFQSFRRRQTFPNRMETPSQSNACGNNSMREPPTSNGFMQNVPNRPNRLNTTSDSTDEPDHLPDPSILNCDSGSVRTSHNIQDTRDGQPSSRVWSDYGSGSDAGNNSSASLPPFVGAGSSMSSHCALFAQGHHQLGGMGGTRSVAEGFHVNSIVTVRDSLAHVSCLDWQERCMELEVALQRFGEQAARVRLLLRDKVRNFSISFSFFF
ncbi:unnamed protein product [Allacma fusca]|uniref:Uncharacterized protein n=1 Tax=Allacma fusca TaxID=39272 RepID=A0A8J2PEB6_9HEXA|nr:unnamed protein product [Allacma fusca]